MLQGRQVFQNILIKLDPDDWDDEKQIVKARHPHASDLNNLINQARSKASDIIIKYRLRERELTAKQFKKEWKNPTSSFEFVTWMKEEIKKRTGTDITEKTAKNHLTVALDIEKISPGLTFADMDEEWIDGFFRTIKRKYPHLNTQETKMKVIKTYLNLARRYNMIGKNLFTNLKIKKAKSNPEHLNEEELQRLCMLYKSGTLAEMNHKIVRHFLFGCFTGLRISDIRALTHEHIIGGMIVKHLEKTRRVNMELVKIPLSKPALKLIKDENPLRVSGPVFMTCSEQMMNRQLKHIAALARINKRITTHIARHTFATTYLRKRPGDIATLQKLLGHSKIEQTLIYVHISDDWKREQMKAFDEYL